MIRFRIDPDKAIFTGQHDKHGTPVFSNDWVCFYEPERESQTHRGDNIPQGSYTEPLEPKITRIVDRVVFDPENAMFTLESKKVNREYGFSFNHLVDQANMQVSVFELKEIFAGGWSALERYWNDEDGDFQYLVAEYGERFGFSTESELAELLTGLEVIQNPGKEKEFIPMRKQYNLSIDQLITSEDLPF